MVLRKAIKYTFGTSVSDVLYLLAVKVLEVKPIKSKINNLRLDCGFQSSNYY